jgi:predicted DNA-binding protein (UPF0251 family)
MSLRHQSARRNRVYIRKFDHEEAIRLHRSGVSYCELGRRMGVTAMTVRRVVLRAYNDVGAGTAW